MTSLSLGIDCGGSGTRWLLASGAETIGAGSLAPLPRPPQGEAGLAIAISALTGLLDEVLAAARPDAVLAGVAGLDEGTAEAVALAGALSAHASLPQGRVRVVNDMRIAYRSAFSSEGGVLVYAGTGSIACIELRDGTLLRAGGYGYLIDDAGGGFWIGREALRSVLRGLDETGKLSGTLAESLLSALGTSDWTTTRSAIYGGGRSIVASLVPAVAAAAGAGDPEASRILRRAGRELARLANALLLRLPGYSGEDASRGDPLPVALAGGIARVGPLLVEPLREALSDGTPFEVREVEPVRGAVRMAEELLAVGVGGEGSGQ